MGMALLWKKRGMKHEAALIPSIPDENANRQCNSQ